MGASKGGEQESMRAGCIFYDKWGLLFNCFLLDATISFIYFIVPFKIRYARNTRKDIAVEFMNLREEISMGFGTRALHTLSYV